MTTIATTTATPDLEIVEGHITTTSTQVAEHFGKAHRSVLLAIRRLECSEEFRLHNFVQSSYINEQGKEQPRYRLTRDGFVFLAMGFTGKEAAQWKEAYIAAFNKMEAELLARTTRPHNPAIDYTRIGPAQAQHIKELVQAIVDAKIQGYGETWARLHKKFRVNSYLELPASRFGEVCNYLMGKFAQPEPAPAQAVPPGKMLVDRQQLAGIYIDLGKLRNRIDAMGMPAQDVPPTWWQQQSISF